MVLKYFQILDSNPHEFSLKFGSSADPGKDVDVNKCVLGCAALFPTESYFAGVRWDGKSKFYSLPQPFLNRDTQEYSQPIQTTINPLI